MTTITHTAQPPHAVVWMLANAGVASRCLHIAAELGVADHVGAEPVPAADLALSCGADADALERALHLLAAHGVFEAADGGFRHTAASELLRGDHPMSMRAFPRMMGLPLFTQTFAQLDHSVATGAPAVGRIAPGGLWEYLEQNPAEAQVFGEAMTAKAIADIAAVLDAYDFGVFRAIADVAGGRGHLLRAVLDAAPGSTGVLFDLPKVIATLDFEHERLTPQAGDFFADPLPIADAYLLMDVIHDWPDDECVAILKAIRRAAAPGARVLVIETVLAEEGPDPTGRTLDVIMLAVTGGRERTLAQLNRLFERAGFSDGIVTETASPLRIVEATAV